MGAVEVGSRRAGGHDSRFGEGYSAPLVELIANLERRRVLWLHFAPIVDAGSRDVGMS